MHQVEVRRKIAAPRQAVWDVYTDHVSWNEWAGIGRVRLDREGAPTRDGVGCVRVISNAGISAFEEVLTFDPPKSMTYAVVRGGLPMRNHLGEVVFEEEGGETLVVWRCRFEAKIPGLGPVYRFIVRKVFTDALAGLARRFERARG